MDSRPVFVLLTAKTCPACHNFKAKVWPSLKQALKNEGRVQIVTIEVDTTQSKPDPVKYHKQLSRFIGWFPTMSLHPAERWYDHNSDLIGIIKNGKIVPPGTDEETGKHRPEHVDMMGKINLSEEDTMKWVDYTLDKPDGMFKRLSGNTNHRGGKLSDGIPAGKFMVPTAGSYAKFEPSKVE